MVDDWKTLRVPTDAWERAREQKESADRTWGEQIVRPDDDNETNDDVAAEVRKLREQVDRVPQDTADELEGRFR